MSDPAVRFSASDDIGVITLNRPDNRNSMTPELLDAFAAAAAEARATRLRCLVVTGTGTCFSSGADFKSRVQRDEDQRAPNERSYAMYEPFLSLLDIAVPVIAALNGHTIGGGFGLAMVCDLRIGARDAKYGANFSRAPAPRPAGAGGRSHPGSASIGGRARRRARAPLPGRGQRPMAPRPSAAGHPGRRAVAPPTATRGARARPLPA
jgi:enoyl-CoA hydratase/carnithine racemase